MNQAIEYDDESLTYDQLNAISNRWAHWLADRGIGRGSRVAIWLPRGIDVHAILLGVLKSGAAYVPIDPEYPLDRVEYIIENSQVRCLISSASMCPEELAQSTLVYAIEACYPQVQQSSAEACNRELDGLRPDDEAYVIYTSGSTGRPKGVSISHRSICHLVKVEGEYFQVHAQDRVFQGFSLAFDASLEEIWLAYHAGATLVIGTSEMVRSGPELSQRLTEKNITVLSCVPTLLQMMGDVVDTVRILIVGGEACHPNLIQRWACGGRKMFNTYGPTEATVIATWTQCHIDQPVTIGRPLPGYRAVIVDEKMQICAVDQAGELLLGGIGLSSGYVGLPELTREKFILDPFASPSNRDQRLYRTGDLCRWNASGDIEYLGRIDAQVKIRGYRVELSEIEAVLLEHESVHAISVSLREDQPDVKHLVAYVVPRSGVEINEQLLRDFARQRLPNYMVPSLVETLAELPTLSSGKVDRRGLPAPRSRIAPAVDDGDVTKAEAYLLHIWRRIFSPLPVSIDNNFFLELGGDSLIAAGMISELRQNDHFLHASMFAIYSHPTIRGFASVVTEEGFDANHDSLAPQESPVVGQGSQALAVGQTDLAHSSAPSLLTAKFALCGIGQFFSLYVVLGLAGLQWLAPFLAYSYLNDSNYSIVASLLGGMLALISVYPPMVFLIVVLKWILLGRLKAGRYPLWGWFYLRWWFVRAVESVIPINYLVGTPLLGFYARMMGAKIGRAVHLGSDTLGTYDLMSIGDGTSISSDSSMHGYSVADGYLTLGPITIGRECYIGTRTLLREGVTMEDGSSLGDLSMLPVGSHIHRGESWRGSPAACFQRGREVPAELSQRHGSCLRRFCFGTAQAFGVMLMPVVVVAALLPGMATTHHLNSSQDYYSYMLLSPLIGLSFVCLLAAEIVVLKWLVLGRVRPGTYSLYSSFSLRKWYIDQLLDLSIDVLGPMYSTLYLIPWYRALGAKIGRLAEVSTASFISPDLLILGEGSFIADIVSLGASRVDGGQIMVDQVQLGARSFVGNSAVIPPGTTLGENCLIGCLSVPPEGNSQAVTLVEDGSSWVGSPAMRLPHRTVNQSFSVEETYTPPAKILALRLSIEFFRVVMPSAGFLCVAGSMFSYVAIMRDEVSEWQVWAFFPLAYLGVCVIFVSTVILLKWVLMGRYRPLERPLWCNFVWRTELVTALHDFFSGPLLLESLRGTPFMAWYFRAMGTRIGKRVFFDTVQISEFDLVQIDDDVSLNADATLQTHLFEDRVMKMSNIHIGNHCVVGAESLVLYDTQMRPGTTLGGMSLLMKGEILPRNTKWEGTPARRA